MNIQTKKINKIEMQVGQSGEYTNCSAFISSYQDNGIRLWLRSTRTHKETNDIDDLDCDFYITKDRAQQLLEDLQERLKDSKEKAAV